MQFEDLAQTVEDAAYVTIGFGVLAFQKTQVQRRELTKQLREQGEQVGAGLGRLAKDLEARIEPVVVDIEGRLPESAKVAVQRARDAGAELARKAGVELPRETAKTSTVGRNGSATKATAA